MLIFLEQVVYRCTHDRVGRHLRSVLGLIAPRADSFETPTPTSSPARGLWPRRHSLPSGHPSKKDGAMKTRAMIVLIAFGDASLTATRKIRGLIRSDGEGQRDVPGPRDRVRDKQAARSPRNIGPDWEIAKD
jgi:hypothetical protein